VAKQTLLHRVVIEQKANIATVEMLIQNGANLYAEDVRGWLPYHYALALDDLEYARLFIKR
jgi:ankyrin repeat protein